MSSPLDTIFKREFAAFASAPQYVMNFDLKVTIHIRNKDFNAIIVSGLSVNKDYFNNYADEIILTAGFNIIDLAHAIYPYKNELEVTVTKTPLTNHREYHVNKAGQPTQMRYIAKLTDEANKLLESNIQDIDLQTTGRKADDYLMIGLQLLDPLVDKIRLKTVGAGFYQNVAMDVIKAVLTKYTNDTVEKDLAINGVTVAPGHSTKVVEHIVVPHLTRLVDFPAIVNKKSGGIYPFGFKYYLTNKQWWIYAPYDGKAYERSEQKLTIVNVTKDKLAEMEITSRVTGTQVFILATGETRNLTNSESVLQNKGVGVRFIDASTVMNYATIEGNKLKVQGSKNTNQVAVVEERDRTSPVVPESEARLTTAYNLEYSKIAQRLGNVVQVAWESSDDRLIYPGMPLRFMYLDGRIARAVYGTVIGCHTQYMQTNTNPRARKFKSNSILTLFIAGETKNDTQL